MLPLLNSVWPPILQDIPPEIEVGSMASRVWLGRAEQLMLFLAYVLTFLVVLVAVIVGKSTTMFMISQVRYLSQIHG